MAPWAWVVLSVVGWVVEVAVARVESHAHAQRVQRAQHAQRAQRQQPNMKKRHSYLRDKPLIDMRSPWLNKNTWFKPVLDASWTTNSSYVINFGADFRNSNLDDVVSKYMCGSDVVGLAVDSDDPMEWAGPGIARRTLWLAPGMIEKLMNEVKVPPSPRLLKVDIDSFDVLVTLAVLEVRRPAFIYVEINEKVQPPVSYCNDVFTEERPWRRLDGDAYGCSLMGYAEALKAKNYVLVSLMYNDALFVDAAFQVEMAALLPDKVLPTVYEAYAKGYAEVPGVHKVFPWNAKNRAFYDSSVPLPIRVDAMDAYPAFVKSRRAEQASFFRAAAENTWPLVTANHSTVAKLPDSSRWHPIVQKAHAQHPDDSNRYLSTLDRALVAAGYLPEYLNS